MPRCDLCGSRVSSIDHMARHQRTQGCQNVAAFVAEKILLLEAELSSRDVTIKELEDRLIRAEGSCEDFKSIVEKAALRPTTATTNHLNQSRNYLQYLSSEPISFSTLEARMPSLVTAEALMRGPRRFNKMLTTAILEDSEGRTKVLCTDQARKQFTYKDEKSGELISDPSLERLRERMRAGIDYGTLYVEVLEELDSCDGDKTGNPAQAHRILHRARFEAPFVNHVARRTYKGAIIHFPDSE